MSDVFGQCVRCGGNLTTGHRCPMSETYEVPRVPFDVRDLIQNLGNMKAEADQRIAALEAEREKIRALLNPTCAEESIGGAIRNLQQAHLSATGNVTTLLAQLCEIEAQWNALKAVSDAKGALCEDLQAQLRERDAEIERLKKASSGYRGNFLWPVDGDSTDPKERVRFHGYEVINGKTEEYIKTHWDALLEAVREESEATIRKAVGLLVELPTQTTNEQRQWEMRRDAFLASPEVAKLKGGE